MPLETIHEAAEALRRGAVTPIDLLEDCFAQIERWESTVHAWVSIDREGTRAVAQERTRELREGRLRGPLHGIPIGIKDIFDVADWPTAAGYGPWAQSIAREDAPTIRALRAAGAVFLGKTVTTQFASFDPPVTRNPWKTSQTPGGSSSGSAAALATRMCLGAMGSQTGGSITRPASFCGVAGLKPTFGALSCAGVMPLSASMDHPGPMARCVRDLGAMFEILRPAGPALVPIAEMPVVGRLRGLFEEQAEPSVNAAVEENCERLRQRGVTIREVALPGEFRDVLIQHRIIMAVEAAQFHRPRFQKDPSGFSPRIRSLVEEGLATPADAYVFARAHQDRMKLAMPDVFRHCQVLLTPATTGPAPAADTTGNPAFNSPWSFTGLPTISFPTGQLADGLPLAIQLVGPAWSEAELFRHALWIEAALEAKPLTPSMPAK